MPVTSHFSEDLHFQGNLVQPGGCLVAGNFEGSIKLTAPDSTLEVRESGHMKGVVDAAAVEIHGHVDAQVQAKHVVISDTAVTRGRIVYDTIAIHGGDNEIALRRAKPD